MMRHERLLITVKTYPTLSRKYGETVCTAAVREDGSWVRIYPIPFRRLEEREQYKKFDWVECRLVRNHADPRPETFRLVDESELCPVAHMDTSDGWRERRKLLLQKARVYTRLDELIAEAKANKTSLAVFRPSRVLDFVWEVEAREWDPVRLREMRDKSQQYDLFGDNAWRETFQVIPKLPYSFSYKFADAAGRTSELQVLDWEAGALFWNCRRMADGDEGEACRKVRQKYFEEYGGKDLHFFVGTTQQFHFRAPNPWVIIGVLGIPHERQMGLF